MSNRRNVLPLPLPRERDTVGPALAWLETQGVRVHRRNVGATRSEYKGKTRYIQFSETGMCDYWFILPGGSGLHVEMEWKRPNGWPRAEQILWMLSVNARGGSAFWARNPETVQFVCGALLRGERLYQYTSGQYEMRVAEPREALAANERELHKYVGILLSKRDLTDRTRRCLAEYVR